MARAGHHSAAVPLAVAYAALLLYASLYPFEGWRWPPGQTLLALLALPSAIHQSSFDVWSNLLGYAPLGGLLALAALRGGARAVPALAVALLVTLALAYGCELLQQFVPGRVPAREDLVMNAAGSLAGAALAVVAHAMGLVGRWQALRQRWFAADAAGALALLALWPVALLFPTPVPLGLGQIGERLREHLSDLLENVPWAGTAHALLAAPPVNTAPLRPLAEVLIVALGLLAPCLVAYTVVAPGWRRLAMVLGAVAAGVSGMALSTLLNFGPTHAMAWLSQATLPGLLLGTVLALLTLPLSQRLTAGIGLMACTGLVVGVAQAGDNPYFAQSLQAWEQGRFVRFHGLAQWVGWLWPYAAMAYLLGRLAARPAAGR